VAYGPVASAENKPRDETRVHPAMLLWGGQIMSRTRLWSGIIIAAGLMALQIMLPLRADAAALDPPVKVRINTAGLAGEAPIFLALDKGYFKAAGFDVELVMAQANSASDTLAMINSGDLDMASFALSAGWLNAVDRGLAVISLMALNTITPTDKAGGVIVRQDLIDSGKYKSAADLQGMNVAAFSLSGAGHYNILQAMKLGGLKPTDIELTTLGPPDILAALGNKSIDAAFNVEPFIFFAKSRGLASMVIPDGQTSPGAPSIVIHANAAFAGRNKEAVERFVMALLRAQREYIAAADTGADKDGVLKALQTHGTIKDMKLLGGINLPTADANGKFDIAAFDAQQQFFIDTGAMKKFVDVRKVFDFSYLDRAIARLSGP
jgi:NitT/TauT family transport system substrate-binding protein